MAFTDYPQIDIKTHRSIGRWNKRFGLLIGIGGIYLGSTGETMAGFVVAVGAFAFAAGQSMQIQALEWEIEQAGNAGKPGET